MCCSTELLLCSVSCAWGWLAERVVVSVQEEGKGEAWRKIGIGVVSRRHDGGRDVHQYLID